MATRSTRPVVALAALLQDASELSKKIVDLFNETQDAALREKLNTIGPDQIQVKMQLQDLLNQYCNETLS